MFIWSWPWLRAESCAVCVWTTHQPLQIYCIASLLSLSRNFQITFTFSSPSSSSYANLYFLILTCIMRERDNKKHIFYYVILFYIMRIGGLWKHHNKKINGEKKQEKTEKKNNGQSDAMTELMQSIMDWDLWRSMTTNAYKHGTRWWWWLAYFVS